MWYYYYPLKRYFESTIHRPSNADNLRFTKSLLMQITSPNGRWGFKSCLSHLSSLYCYGSCSFSNKFQVLTPSCNNSISKKWQWTSHCPVKSQMNIDQGVTNMLVWRCIRGGLYRFWGTSAILRYYYSPAHIGGTSEIWQDIRTYNNNGTEI